MSTDTVGHKEDDASHDRRTEASLHFAPVPSNTEIIHLSFNNLNMQMRNTTGHCSNLQNRAVSKKGSY